MNIRKLSIIHNRVSAREAINGKLMFDYMVINVEKFFFELTPRSKSWLESLFIRGHLCEYSKKKMFIFLIFV